MNDQRDGQFGAFGRSLYQKWMRDESLPVEARFEKAAAFLLGLARAAAYLRQADEVARDVRVIGRPLVRNQGRLTIGPRCVLRSIVAPVELSVGPGGTMIIGADAHINSGATFAALAHVELGERVEVGPHVTVYDNNFHDVYDRNALPESRPVIIEDDVWLCAKSTVLPGVRIGRGAVVSANALVVADVEPFTVVSGVPAREIRKLDPQKFVITRPYDNPVER
jgi:acetyltransferase-like isoleucine patch superfamily enzyme